MAEPEKMRNIPVPPIWTDNIEFWEHCSKHHLTVRRCQACKQAHWYPRTLCPFCMGTTALEIVTGKGTIYTYSITRRAGPEPYCIAYVDLDEGVRLLTNIVGCDLDKIKVGACVRVLFQTASDRTEIPMFTLDAG